MYNPLPDYITIKESAIQGLGLFATEKIKANSLIGVIHHPQKKVKTDIFVLLWVDLEIILMIPIVIKY